MAWTEDRIQRLRKLWNEGMTATQIADELGGVSRNAVIGKAHRIGLEARQTEPLVAVRGASVPAIDLVQYRWRDGARYLHADCNRVIHAACAIAVARAKTPTAFVTAHDLVDGLVALTRYVSPSSRAGRVGRHFADADISPASDALDIADKLATPPHDKAVEASVLRWDVIEILQRAARIRARTGHQTKPIDLTHVVCGLLLTTAGHLGFSDAGLLGAGFDRLQRLALAVIADAQTAASQSDNAEWREIEDEVMSQEAFGFRSQSRPDYTSDRAVAGRDALGAGTDARALANLILLEAAEPPLAIAVFGAWGAGKSTLLAELRQEVHRQSQAERNRIAAERASLPDQPAIVSGIIQVDFNAWTFADSENLWASMTAELFDQIAAGGHDQNVGEHGARLVKEVAARTGHETEAHRQAETRLRASDEAIAAAEAALTRNSQKRTTGLVDASTQALLELFGPVKGSDSNTTEKATDSRQNDALAPFRNAILADNATKPDVKIRSYVEASGPIARFIMLLWDYAWRGATLTRWLLIAGGVALSLLIIAWLQGRLFLSPPAWPTWAGWIAPSIPVLISIGALVLPSVRAAAVLTKAITDTKERLRQEGADAQDKLDQGLQARREAEKSLKEASDFLTRYGDVAELTAAPPALMLDYLLRESADITSIKAKMGFLGTVRRCFDQLNAVVERARTLDPNSPVQRIIIYIDDLDRCSERQVVQVLEAVHLLLAYPCFVVVAAVDGRWLEHALLSQHRALAGGGHTVTPADYLEKIFQVPFWIRPMDDGVSQSAGYRRYMRELLGAGQRIETREERPDSGVNSAPLQSGQFLRRVHPHKPEAGPLMFSRRLILTDPERELLLALGPLAARSPRAVKRMVNLYRLIRASTDAWEDLDGLQGGALGSPSFYSVQLLLACEVGLSASVMSELATAIGETNNEDWIAFATAVTEQRQVPAGQIASALSQSTDLQRFMQGVTAMIHAADRTPAIWDLRVALAVISRYSFRARV